MTSSTMKPTLSASSAMEALEEGTTIAPAGDSIDCPLQWNPMKWNGDQVERRWRRIAAPQRPSQGLSQNAEIK